MDNRFSNGYFGIQRSSKIERQILFSVFSDFDINNSSMEMEDYRVTLMKKGSGVTVQDFGNKSQDSSPLSISPGNMEWRTSF